MQDQGDSATSGGLPGESAPPPFQSVGFMLSQLGFATAERFKRVMHSLDLEPRQFAVLRSIAWNEGQPQHVIGQLLQIPPSSMVALVDQLEKRGLVARRAHPTDRRARTLHLVPKGRSLLTRAMQCATTLENELCRGLTSSQRDQLLHRLSLVAGNLGLSPGVHPAASSHLTARESGGSE